MTMFNAFLNVFKQGMRGNNKGIPLNFPKLEKFLNGMHRGRYYTLFSEGGTGKSSFAWSTFVIGPLDHMLRHNRLVDAREDLTDEQKAVRKVSIRIILYSLEVVKSEVIAKMVCLKIYRDYGIIVSADYILNRIDDCFLSPSIAYIVQTYQAYFEMLEKEGYLTIIDSPRSPSQIRKELHQFAEKHGTFKENRKGEMKYTPNNPKEFVLPIFDTVGNITVEPVNGKSSVKSTIDAHSANCRFFYRDTLNWMPTNISHSNRDMNDPGRAKNGEVFPKLSDIKETNMLEQDSSVVLTIFNPMNHLTTVTKLANFMKYDIRRLGERFRCIGILKNRHGGVNKRVGLLYIGENAHFQELKSAKNMQQEDYADVRNLTEARYLKEAVIKEIILKRNPRIKEKLETYTARKNAERKARKKAA